MDEFQARVVPLVARKVRALNSKDRGALYGGGPYLSMDNARPHNGGFEALQKSSKLNWMQLPPLSHDMHKVIEHVINRIKANTDKVLRGNTAITANEQVRKVLRAEALKLHNDAGIRKDICSLMHTYAVISKPKSRGGTAGNWPPKGLR